MSFRRLLACGAFATLLLCAGGARALDPSTPLSQYGLDAWQDGLPQNTVHSILQTREGYLWFGTFTGLVRFDGARFTVESFGRYVLHDPVHHVWDVEQGYAALEGR